MFRLIFKSTIVVNTNDMIIVLVVENVYEPAYEILVLVTSAISYDLVSPMPLLLVYTNYRN